MSTSFPLYRHFPNGKIAIILPDSIHILLRRGLHLFLQINGRRPVVVRFGLLIQAVFEVIPFTGITCIS